jgi:hypothetical protein
MRLIFFLLYFYIASKMLNKILPFWKKLIEKVMEIKYHSLQLPIKSVKILKTM